MPDGLGHALLQDGPPAHAEPVLFVDHDQPQVAERRGAEHQRLRADHDVGLAG